MNTILIKPIAFGQDYFIDVATEAIINMNNRMLYDEAELYCQFLDYGDYTDWRLPLGIECMELSNFLTNCGFAPIQYWAKSTIDKGNSYAVVPVRYVVK